jgi:hypothetical protein
MNAVFSPYGLYLRNLGHLLPAWIPARPCEPAAAGIAEAWDVAHDLIDLCG